MFELQKASRKKVKIKMGINGPSGSGKTMSALLAAFGLCGDWGKIAVVDTENESASLYEHVGAFETVPFPPPFTPERYIQAIKAAEKPHIEVIIIDSGSHEWSGAGGCIEINEKLAQAKYRGNTWSAWNETTPRHDAFINYILQSPFHFIVCNRSKTETVMGDDKKIKKLGMKEIQREGMEYEWSLSFNLDRDTHTASPSKDRTGLFEGRDPFVITPAIGHEIKRWCELGKEINQPVKTSDDRETLTMQHPSWTAVVAGVKGGYTIAQVELKYIIDPVALVTLNAILAQPKAEPVKAVDPAPVPVTQADIKASNSGYVPSTNAPKAKPF